MADKVQITIEVASKSDVDKLIAQFKQLGTVSEASVQKAVDAANRGVDKQIEAQNRLARTVADLDVKALRRREDQEIRLGQLRQRSIEREMQEAARADALRERLAAQAEARETRRRERQEREEQAAASRRARFALTPVLGTTGNSGIIGAALQGAGALGLGSGSTGASVAGGLIAGLGPTAIAIASLTAAAAGAATALAAFIISVNKAALETVNFASRTGLRTDQALLLERMANREGISASSLVQVGRYVSNVQTNPKGDPQGEAALRDLGARTGGPINVYNPNGGLRSTGDMTLDILKRLSMLPRGDALQRRWESLLEGRGAAGIQPVIENFARDMAQESKGLPTGGIIDVNAESARGFNSLKNRISNASQVLAFATMHPSVLFDPSSLPGATASTANSVKAGSGIVELDVPAPPSLSMSFTNDDEGDAEAINALKQDLPTYEMLARGNGAGPAAVSKAKGYVAQIKARINSILDAKKFRTKQASDFNFRTGRLQELRLSGDAAMGKSEGESSTLARYADERGIFLGRGASPSDMLEFDTQYARRIAGERHSKDADVAAFARQSGLNLSHQAMGGVMNFNALAMRSGFKNDEAGQRGANQADYEYAVKAAHEQYDYALKSITTLDQTAAAKERITASDKLQGDLNKAGLDYAEAELRIKKESADLADRVAKQRAQIDSSGARTMAQGRIRSGTQLTVARYGRGEEGLASVAAERGALNEAAQLAQFELSTIDKGLSLKEKENEQRKIAWQYANDVARIEEEHAVTMARYEEEHIAKMKATYGSIFDAITKGSGAQFFKPIGKTMFENVLGVAAQHGILPDLGKMVGGQTRLDASGNPQLTTIGKILKGTPFGVDQSQLAQQMEIKATVDNTNITMLLNTTMQNLMASLGVDPATGSASGTSASSSVIGALGNLPLVGPYASGAGSLLHLLAPAAAVGAAAGASAAITGSVPSITSLTGGVVGNGMPAVHSNFGSNYKTPISGMLDSTASTGSRVASGVAAAGVIFGSAMDLKHNLSMGGVQGGLGDAQDILGMASLIPGPVGMVAAAGSMVLGMVKGIFGDPKARKQKQIDTYLQNAQFLAPVALHETVGTNGGFADYGMGGMVRSSTFNPTPQVTEPFVDAWKTGGIIDPTYTYTTVPGATTRQYGGNVNQGVAPTKAPTIIINAMDTQGFIKNAPAIAAGLHAAVNSGQADLLIKTLSDRVKPK